MVNRSGHWEVASPAEPPFPSSLDELDAVPRQLSGPSGMRPVLQAGASMDAASADVSTPCDVSDTLMIVDETPFFFFHTGTHTSFVATETSVS